MFFNNNLDGKSIHPGRGRIQKEGSSSTRVKKLETKIDLEKIDHKQDDVFMTLRKTGVNKDEYSRCVEEIQSYRPQRLREEIDKLGFKKRQVIEVSEKYGTLTESVAGLWKSRRKEITLKEFVLTVRLVKKTCIERAVEKNLSSGGREEQLLAVILNMALEKEVKKLEDAVETKIIKFVEDSGSTYKRDTPECELWRKEHDNDSRGCPFHLGCIKHRIIHHVIEELCTAPLRYADNPITEIKWVDLVVFSMFVIIGVYTAKSVPEMERNLRILQATSNE